MIPCERYDDIEVVCLFQYPVRLTLKSGRVIEGTALDTARDERGEECMELKVGEETVLVVLDELTRMEVCVENPHFRLVTFP